MTRHSGIQKILRQFSLLVVLGLFAIGCKDKELPPFTKDNEINEWIYAEMKRWYYWTDKIPAHPDYNQPPDQFFKSLLFSYDPVSRPDGDRFSWMQKDVNELLSSLSGESVSLGFEYRIVVSSALNRTVGTVLYVLPGSQADKAGVKRGDFFIRINGEDLTVTNFRTLLSGSSEKHLTFAGLDEEHLTFINPREISLKPDRLQEDPVHFFTVLNWAQKRVGYLVYHQFFPSASGTDDNRYDKKLNQVFSEFKNQKINELIIDLRYNSGGYVSSSIHLASLIARSVNDRNIFSVKEYNPEITRSLKHQFGRDYFEDHFQVLPQNIGNQLDRVFFLTSERTASASELMINGLMPYMPVKIIGSTTAGKNVGSVTIRDEKKRTVVGLQPIVSKSFNRLKQSDYSSGFKPDAASREGLKIYAYGDEQDPLLKQAALLMLGDQSAVARKKKPETIEIDFTEIGNSLTGKAAYGRMIDTIILPED